jgi:hypothetical protein
MPEKSPFAPQRGHNPLSAALCVSGASGTPHAPRIRLHINWQTAQAGCRKAGLERESVRARAVAIDQPEFRQPLLNRGNMSFRNPPQRLITRRRPLDPFASACHYWCVCASINEGEQCFSITPYRHVNDELRIGRWLEVDRVAALTLQTPNKAVTRFSKLVDPIEHRHKTSDNRIILRSDQPRNVDLRQLPVLPVSH